MGTSPTGVNMTNQEPNITIDGKTLNSAQAMTIRVACESFIFSLLKDGLGDDEHGREMTKLYLDRLYEIREMIYGRRIK